MTLCPQLASKMRRVGEARWQELYDETKGSPLTMMYVLGLLRTRTTLTFDGTLQLLRGNHAPDLQTFIFQEVRRELTRNDEAGLRALSFFVPSATLEAWMRVAMLSRNALNATIDRLDSLSLMNEMMGEDCHALHPVTRNFVRDELLANTQIERETGIRFVRYWNNYVKRNYRKVDDYKDFDLLETELMNIQAAANWGWLTVKAKNAGVTDKNSMQILKEQVRRLEEFFCRSAYGDSEIS